MDRTPLPASQAQRRMRRLIGLVVLAVWVGLIVMLFVPGAGEVAQALGKQCQRSRGGGFDQCHALDVVAVVVFVSPLLVVIGLGLIGSPLVARRADDDASRS